MDTWPVITRKGSHNFIAEPGPNAVLIANTASGYPVLNKLFTFDATTFVFELRSVSEADKLTVMAFYKSHKEVPFYWPNPQDSVTYEVGYVGPPRCRIDGRIDLWRIGHVLRQTSTETS